MKMKRVWVEVSCNYCGCGDYYARPAVDEQAKKNGWLVIGAKHFCGEECRVNYVKQKANG
jgi:hypothetical protein